MRQLHAAECLAVPALHHQVEDDEAGRETLKEEDDGVSAVPRGDDADAAHLEKSANGGHRLLVVVDDENRSHKIATSPTPRIMPPPSTHAMPSAGAHSDLTAARRPS